jgi:hypothetical protein
MNFKEWLSDNGDLFWEALDPSKMDVSKIHLEPMVDEFDEDDAQRECERDARYFDDSEYYSGVYDNWEDDPDFEAPITVDSWEDDNPEPEKEDFETDEEFNDALKTWQDERDKVDAAFEEAIQDWERDMRSRRSDAEEAAETARQEEIDNCVEEKRREYLDVDHGFKHTFSHDGQDFEVTFQKEPRSYNGKYLDNVFSVMFQGPEGYSTTGMAGTKATAIYGKLIGAVKKLIDTQDVEALTFTPAEPAMRIMYERFYQSFLKKEFVRVASDFYVRRDIVKDFIKGIPAGSQKRQDLYDTAKKAHVEAKSNVAAAELLKSIRRNAVRIGPSLVGKFVPVYNGSRPVFVVNFDPSQAKFRTITMGHNGPLQSELDYYKIALPFTSMTKEDAAGDMLAFNQSLDYNDIQKFPLLTPGGLPGLYSQRPSPPNYGNFTDEVRQVLGSFGPIMSHTFRGQKAFAEDFESQYPVAAKAFMDLIHKFNIPTPGLTSKPQAPVAPPAPAQQAAPIPSRMGQQMTAAPEVQSAHAGVPAASSNVKNIPSPASI